MSDSVRPHPWDSPGKNTGVGCRFLLQCIKVESESEVAQSCLTRRDPMDCSLPGSSAHGIFQARVLEWGAIAFSKVFPYYHFTHIYSYSYLFLSPHLFYLQWTYQSPPGILVHICMWCVLFLPCWNVSSIYHDLSSLLLYSQLFQKCLISHRCLIVVHEWMQIKARYFPKKNSIMETPFSED